ISPSALLIALSASSRESRSCDGEFVSTWASATLTTRTRRPTARHTVGTPPVGHDGSPIYSWTRHSVQCSGIRNRLACNSVCRKTGRWHTPRAGTPRCHGAAECQHSIPEPIAVKRVLSGSSDDSLHGSRSTVRELCAAAQIGGPDEHQESNQRSSV